MTEAIENFRKKYNDVLIIGGDMNGRYVDYLDKIKDVSTNFDTVTVTVSSSTIVTLNHNHTNDKKIYDGFITNLNNYKIGGDYFVLEDGLLSVVQKQIPIVVKK